MTAKRRKAHGGNGRGPKRILVKYIGGEWDGRLEDFSGRPGIEHGHPKLIGKGRLAYVLDHITGETGYYRLPTEEELDRPL